MITKYKKYCIVCGKPNAECHHLCYGNAKGGLNAVHNNGTLEVFSKIIGQLWFMLLDTTTETQREQSIERFRKRYGKSYI